MLVPRQAFGICAVGNFIYTAGGVTSNHQYSSSTDRYCVLTDKWENLPTCTFPFPLFANSLVCIRKRYIYQLGF